MRVLRLAGSGCRVLLLLLAATYFGPTVRAQPTVCPGIYVLTSQQALTTFGGLGCTHVDGSVIVKSIQSRISDLSALAPLISVRDDLEISDIDGVSSLNVLANLDHVGGDLVIDRIHSLASLAGLGGIGTLGGDLEISGIPLITSLTGLPATPTTIGGRLIINSNAALETLAGLPAGLASLGGGLTIHNNAALLSLAGLPQGITSIGGRLTITENPLLTSLAGLPPAITRINGVLSIQHNAALTSLDGLPRGLSTVGGDLYVANNPLLSACACPLRPLMREPSPGAFDFGGVSGQVYVSDNGGPACSTPGNVLTDASTCPSADACADPSTLPQYAGGYVLSTDHTRAFVGVTAPTGAAMFTFYRTHNLIVGAPEASPASSPVPLPGVVRSGVPSGTPGDVTFAFASASPTAVYFPITAGSGASRVAFYLEIIDTCGRSVDLDPAFTIEGQHPADDLVMEGPTPNPTTSGSAVHFTLREASQVEVTLYDVLGRPLQTQGLGHLEPGTHTAYVDTSSLAAGPYLCTLSTGSRRVTRFLQVTR